MSREVVPGLVSVVIPAYDAEAFIAETLDSVLAQTWTPFEVVVVDDGSTDGTIAVAESFGDRVRVVACPHRGHAATRNAGIEAARGEFIAFIDADDLMPPDALAIRMRHMLADPALDMVAGRLMCFLTPNMSEEDRRRFMVPPEPQQGHLPGAAIIRVSAFVTHGLIDESVPVLCELEWTVRAQDAGARIRQIDDVVVHRRIHGRNLTLRRKQELDADRLRILRASLARRRRAAAPTAETAK